MAPFQSFHSLMKAIPINLPEKEILDEKYGARGGGEFLRIFFLYKYRQMREGYINNPFFLIGCHL